MGNYDFIRLLESWGSPWSPLLDFHTFRCCYFDIPSLEFAVILGLTEEWWQTKNIYLLL